MTRHSPDRSATARQPPSAPFGIAVDYRASWCGPSPRSRPGALSAALLAEARASLPHLTESKGAGIFLATGSRLSVGPTGLVVFETAECADPWTAVLQVRAGELLLQDLADRIAGASGSESISIERVEGGWRESFFCRRAPQDLVEQLVPLLISRICYAGAGGFDPSDASLRFVLSVIPFQWQSRLSKLIDVERPSRLRRLANPNAGQWVRVVTGDSLGCDLGAVLSLGGIALVRSTAEIGRLGPPVALRQPLRGWRTIAAGSDLTSKVRLMDGRSLTALEIQRLYLDQVERCLTDLPPWADAFCQLWRSALDQLTRPATVVAFDWQISMARLETRIRAQPDWRALSEWNDRWGETVRLLGFALADSEVDRDRAEAFGRALTRWATVRGPAADGAVRYYRLRKELFQLDAASRRLGDAKPAAGRLFDDKEVGRARVTPPPDTRAAVRGKWVGRLGKSEQRTRFRCDWGGLRDLVAGTSIDLADPAETVAEWRSAEHRSGQGDLFAGLKEWFSIDF